MNSREEGGRDKSLSSLLFKIPALQLKRENDLGVNCIGTEVLHDNGTSERVSGPPAGYLYPADYAIWLQPFMPGLEQRAPGGGGHHSRVPGQFLSLHHPFHYERAWVSIRASGSWGRQLSYKLTWHTLAHTPAYLNIIIKAPERPRRGPAARRAGLPADRKELIN